MATCTSRSPKVPRPPNFEDCCRKCGKNLRVHGQLKGYRKIFDPPDPNSKEADKRLISDRLAAVGIVLQRRKDVSERLCQLCKRDLARMEEGLKTFQKWKDLVEREKETQPTRTDPQQTPPRNVQKRMREPTPSKTPRAVKKRLGATSKAPPKAAPQRTSETKVTVTYRSRVDRPANIACKDPVIASIVENIARGEFKTAARVMFTCEELAEQIKAQSLNLLEQECANLTAIKSNFILRKTSAQDLVNFSLNTFQSDLKRLSPFFHSILSTVTEDSRNHICASASVAIRGRNNQLSAFSHYINTVLQHGGAKTSVFKRLCQFGISTAQENGRLKQKELASTCGHDLHVMKEKLEAYAVQKMKKHAEDGSKETHAEDGEMETHAEDGEMETHAEDGEMETHAEDGEMETHAEDGEMETHAEDGEMETHAEDGSKETHTEDGKVETHAEDGKVETHAEDGKMETHAEDGSKETHTEDGKVETHAEDGKVETHAEDGKMETHAEDGSKETHTEDGKVETHAEDGKMETHAEDGSKETHADDGKMHNFTITTEDFSDLAVGFLVAPIEPECPPPSIPPSSPPSRPPSPPPPPKYSVQVDNLDFYKPTHHQSETKGNESIHWTHHIGIQDRVPTDHLPNNAPIKPLPLFQIGDCLPTPEIEAHLRNELIIIGSRMVTTHIPALKPFAPAVIHHIPHQYSETMSQPSTEVSHIKYKWNLAFPLGLLFKNESVTSDLVDILQHIQTEYVPRTPDGMQSIFMGGDRLTEGNSRSVQWAFGDGENPEDRLEGLIAKFDDWHARRVLYGIHFKAFGSERSGRDHGTLFANMNRVKCSNAKKGPHNAFNAYQEFVRKDTTALFIAAAMKVFKMENVEDVPKDLPPDLITKDKLEQRRWLNDKVGQVVDEFVINTDMTNMMDIYHGVSQAAQPRQIEELSCREPECERTFVYPKARLNHERKVHGLDFGEPIQEEESTAKPSPSARDHKKEHTEARLSFGLFLEDMHDAVKEGDGERMIRLYRIALMFYRAYGHTQYAYSTLLLLVQVNAVLSPAEAHGLKWNRFFNGKGGKGRNISCDLHLEHCNNDLKKFLKGMGANLTEASAYRVSRSLGPLRKILANADRELRVARPSGYHHSASETPDILTLVEVIREADLFNFSAGRAFVAFPNFDRNLLGRIKYDNMWEWIKAKLKLWNRKYP
ncbi:uncharacterized protein LOC118403462 [Branchiostoma floridae]|uniref:Uncharacterized protein LOC118403462 n=1 Tax=Branchiostoma floridae TaxID=7739 RepID=A0A9J7K5W3_BRAFL|nr:uncharacterized protein LOC118403462 [Branchiostoma floridae]